MRGQRACDAYFAKAPPARAASAIGPTGSNRRRSTRTRCPRRRRVNALASGGGEGLRVGGGEDFGGGNGAAAGACGAAKASSGVSGCADCAAQVSATPTMQVEFPDRQITI